MATNGLIGEISIYAGPKPPAGWSLCNGQLLASSANPQLFSQIGQTFGGTGGTFALPNLSGRMATAGGPTFPFATSGGEATHVLSTNELPVHTHQAYGVTTIADTGSPNQAFWAAAANGHFAASADCAMSPSAISDTGGNQPHDNMPPYMPINFAICAQKNGVREGTLGEVILYAGKDDFPEKDNWLPCDGRVIYIAAAKALFSVLGNAYGGDGKVTFALPDLRDRVPLGAGTGFGLTPRVTGQTGGETEVVLSTDQMPKHSHLAHGSTSANSVSDPTNGIWGRHVLNRLETPLYANSADETPLNETALDVAGGGAGHNNMPPYLALKYLICIAGIYPSRP